MSRGGNPHLAYLATLLLGPACTLFSGHQVPEDSAAEPMVDEDGDGVSPEDGDCDDHDASIGPQVEEVWYDGFDQDCDDESDYDADGDGHLPSEWLGGDCDDQDPAIHPQAEEIWYDGFDQDCEGDSDYDADGDGFDAQTWGEDCDDTDASIHPGALEARDGLDGDCDGRVDSPLSLAGAELLLLGFMPGQQAGIAAVAAGDINADGVDDLLVGSQGFAEDPTGGAAYLLLGPVTGPVDLAAADNTIRGAAHSMLGWGLAGLGDMDGDGLDDIAVGAWRDDRNANEGALFIYQGDEARYGGGGVFDSYPDCDVYLRGYNEEEVGRHVAALGDVNADGLGDFLVASLTPGDPAGTQVTVYLWQGPITLQSIVSKSAATMNIDVDLVATLEGTSLAGPGDLNGDGLADVAIGQAWREGVERLEGAAFVLLSPLVGVLALEADAPGLWTGESTYDFAGYDLTGAGDHNGDGYQDLVVGSYGADENGTDAGLVHLLYGPATGVHSLSDAPVRISGIAANDHAGQSVCGPGDLDGDGFPDLAIGAPGALPGGAAHILLGPLSGTLDLSQAVLTLNGSEMGDQLGRSVRPAGDPDADGLPDLLVTAMGYDGAGEDAGAVWLVPGAYLAGLRD